MSDVISPVLTSHGTIDVFKVDTEGNEGALVGATEANEAPP